MKGFSPTLLPIRVKEFRRLLRFATSFSYPSIAEVIVRLERGVQRRDQVEQRLARNRIAQRDALVPGQAAAQDLGRHVLQGLRRRQGLQIGRSLLRGEPLVQGLIVARHLARVRLDPAVDRAVAGLDVQLVVDRLEPGTFQQLHLDFGELFSRCVNAKTMPNLMGGGQEVTTIILSLMHNRSLRSLVFLIGFTLVCICVLLLNNIFFDMFCYYNPQCSAQVVLVLFSLSLSRCCVVVLTTVSPNQ